MWGVGSYNGIYFTAYLRLPSCCRMNYIITTHNVSLHSFSIKSSFMQGLGLKVLGLWTTFIFYIRILLGINTILLYLQHFENEKSVLPYSWIIRKKFKGIVWHFMKYTYSLFALRITWGNPSHSRRRSVDMKLQSTDS